MLFVIEQEVIICLTLVISNHLIECTNDFWLTTIDFFRAAKVRFQILISKLYYNYVERLWIKKIILSITCIHLINNYMPIRYAMILVFIL
ncbi:MAG: hypothetical protein RJA07_2104 [Bacteroidota bacterium]|jgi:hypothetical protein